MVFDFTIFLLFLQIVGVCEWGDLNRTRFLQFPQDYRDNGGVVILKPNLYLRFPRDCWIWGEVLFNLTLFGSFAKTVGISWVQNM